MKEVIAFIFLFRIVQFAFGQTSYSVDTLMKQKNVKIETQYECDFGGKNCRVLYKHYYDNQGRLIKYIEFSGKNPS